MQRTREKVYESRRINQKRNNHSNLRDAFKKKLHIGKLSQPTVASYISSGAHDLKFGLGLLNCV